MEQFYTTMASPVGFLKLVATDAGLAAVLWEDDDPKRVRLGRLVRNPEHPVLKRTVQQLREYFAGEREAFDIHLASTGTEFQKAVWNELAAIPFGYTRSYAQVAAAIGRPDAVRAVGGAIGRNPLSIITPCHRVIGSNGSMVGFAGGILTKQYLLSHEKGETARATRIRSEPECPTVPAE